MKPNRKPQVIPITCWVVSSAGRASPLQGEGRGFEPLTTHHRGAVVQSVRIPACHAGGRGFESRPLRHFFSLLLWFLSLLIFLLLFSKFPVVIRGNLLSVFCRSCFDQSFISFLFARREALSSC